MNTFFGAMISTAFVMWVAFMLWGVRAAIVAWVTMSVLCVLISAFLDM